MFTAHNMIPFLFYGGFMEEKRKWGKSILYYCPETKKVWQYSSKNDIITYRDMPTYGLPRKELPQ